MTAWYIIGTHAHCRPVCSSYTASPSVNQWLIRLSVAASVTVWVNSWRSTWLQLNDPCVFSPLRGGSSAMIRPVLAPTVPIHGLPVVRTLNASWVGNTSMMVFSGGSVLYSPQISAYRCSR